MSKQVKDRKFYNRKLHALSIVICGTDTLLRQEIENMFFLRARTKGTCFICGCTESNCKQCIEASGEACSWANEDETLCTRCVKTEKWSVTQLTDPEAEQLYNKLVPLSISASKNLNALKLGAGIKAGALMTDDQRKAIIKILKYNLKWSAQASFEFIVTAFPEYRRRLTPGEIANYDLFALYGILQFGHADKIIKRLDKIQNGKKTQKKTGKQNKAASFTCSPDQGADIP